MYGKSLGDAIGVMMTLAIVSFGALVIVGIWAGVDYFFIEDTYETKKPITPEVVIKTETRNGVINSDTTYIYHLK
jgi:hypothetical protein